MSRARRSLCGITAAASRVVVATGLVVGLVACAPAVRPIAPTAGPRAAAAAPRAPGSRRLQAPNVEALKAALVADGYEIQVSARKDGRVAVINFTGKVPTTKLPHQIFSASMAMHGNSLGYGKLGEVALGGASRLAGPLGSIIGSFPKAQGCPGLRYEASFEELDATTRAPHLWVFACPNSDDDMAFFGQVHEQLAQIAEARRRSRLPEVVDPFAVWLKSQGIPIEQIRRSPTGVHARMPASKPLVGDRFEEARAFAVRAAAAEGLPPLDKVDLAADFGAAKTRQPLKTRFRKLTLRLAAPPLDGACIDPRVVVWLDDVAGVPSSVRVAEVSVACAKEPAQGTKAPPDAGRVLPRAASGSPQFMAFCHSLNFAWGYRHSGTVIDKRGDVYSFDGGPPFSGNSAQELARIVRQGKHYIGTLPPGDVDRLASLAPRVEREPFVKREVRAFDLPSGGCDLFRAGASADELVKIRLDQFGQTMGHRVGPASREVSRVLGKGDSSSTMP